MNKESITLTIGEQIEDLIKAQGDTQASAAKKMGLSASLLSDLINGRPRNYSISNIKKICKYFKLSADVVLGIAPPSNDAETFHTVLRYTGLSSSTINCLHYQPDVSIRSFYRKLFDSIVQIGDDGLETVPELIRCAAEAHVIAKRESLDIRHGIENSIASLSVDGDGCYKIPAKDAEDFFLMEAQSEICKCLANVLDDMEYEVIKEIEQTGKIGKNSFEWIIVDDEAEERNPWFLDEKR